MRLRSGGEQDGVRTPEGMAQASVIAPTLHIVFSVIRLCGGGMTWENLPDGGKRFEIVLGMQHPPRPEGSPHRADHK